MSQITSFKPRSDRPLVVITDFDFGNVSLETEILEAAGAKVVAMQAKREEDLFEVAPDCAAIMNQYAKIGQKTITRMQKCEVIARYGVGVDIVDVGAASEKGILVSRVTASVWISWMWARHQKKVSLSLTCKTTALKRWRTMPSPFG